MHVPSEIAGRLIDAVTTPEHPEAQPSLGFDLKIIAHRPEFAGPPPPFAMDALGAVTCNDPINLSPPAKTPRRMVGQQRHHAGERFGTNEKP